MAFVVEDGSGLANANSYSSVADADAYFSDRGITAWTGSNTVKEQALVRATDFIESVFGQRFRGAVTTDTQSLSFPRYINDTIGSVPACLKKATAEYALRALSASLLPDPAADTSGLALSQKTTVVGPIETTYKYATTIQAIVKNYPAADLLLAPLVRPASVVRC